MSSTRVVVSSQSELIIKDGSAVIIAATCITPPSTPNYTELSCPRLPATYIHFERPDLHAGPCLTTRRRRPLISQTSWI